MAMTTRDRRALVILGVIVVAALAAYFLFLRPGDGDPLSVGSPTPSATDTTSPQPSPTRTGTPRPSPTSSGIPVAAKDPFSPLVTPGDDGDGGPTDGGTDGGTSPAPTGTDGTTSPAPTGTDGTTSPAPTGTDGTTSPSVSPPTSDSPVPGGGTSIVIGGHDVTLIDLFVRGGKEMAQVVVDGEGFTVSEGETFDENFRLVSIGTTCATFLFGDEQFVLCENPQK